VTDHKLKISKDLALPLDAATQTFAFIGRKGSGKTYGSGKLVELLIGAGIQVAILDTVGNWYGLRLAADGKAPGIDIPILGGLRGDIPLEATGGALIADALVESGRSMIIDASQFNKSDRQRFAFALGERLWKRKKAEPQPTPIHLVIEESQLIVPERIQGGGDLPKMVGIYEEIIRLGRNYGIGVTMITQRPQSVNKEVLNQTECLMVFQVNGAHERKALREWIVYQGMDPKLLDQLPGLQPGECFVWSPQWLQILERIRVAEKWTFDSTRTPKVGDHKLRAREIKPIDLEGLKVKMAATIERAKAEDPRELRRQVADLQRKVAAVQNAPAAQAEPVRVEVPILSAEQENALKGLVTVAENLEANQVQIQEKLSAEAHIIEQLHSDVRALQAALKLAVGQEPRRTGRKLEFKFDDRSLVPLSKLRARGIPLPPAMSRPSPDSNGSVGTGGRRRMLIALAQRPRGLNSRQLGVRAGLSSKSGTFTTYLARARSSGWIDGHKSRLTITTAGLSALGDWDPLPTGQGLLQYWLGQLGASGAARILSSLANVYPEALSKQDLAEASGMTGNSGTYTTYLARLRSLELIEGRGELRASAELFE
jgi:hypothetical protein